MQSSIYWFSGTGNSLSVAKKLSQSLGMPMVSIANAERCDMVGCEGDTIGLVFPVYNHFVPYIVKRFIEKIDSLEGKYIFAVCTFGDSNGIALKYLAKLISAKGGRLSAGFGIKMPYNYVSPTGGLVSALKPFPLRRISPEAQEKMFFDCDNKLVTICDYVRARKYGDIETEYEFIEHLADKLNLRETLQKTFWLKKAGFKGRTKKSCIESIQLMDYGFFCDDVCVGCQICVKICPVKNIEMLDGKPSWNHKCEQCFACLQWCPKGAIQFREVTRGNTRYQNPLIDIKELMSLYE